MKYIYIILLVPALLLLSGCKKWLDVKPNNVVNEDEIFSDDGKGFQSALAGVYYKLSATELYGRELKFGLLDAMVGYYNISATGHTYSDAAKFDFTNITTRPKIDGIWSGLYNSINTINIILNNVEKIKGNSNYALIKGEALGLRGLLHLDLLKYFGPVIKTDGLETAAIPYYSTVGTHAKKKITSRQVLDQVEIDLQEALVLLANDPIKKIGRTGNANGNSLDYNSILDRRGVRMNYYAVLALLARKSQWEGNQQEAFIRAKRVVDELANSNAVALISGKDIASNYQPDLRFASENIFGLYVNDFKKQNITNGILPGLQDGYGTNTVLLPDYDYLNANLYSKAESGSTNDYRLLYWFASYQGVYRLIKFQIDDNAATFYNQYEVTMISLAEMYYIMAEAKLDTDPQNAIDILNQLRKSRNLITPIAYSNTLTKPQLLQYIIDEARKQSIGEGYMYGMYKRLYVDFFKKSGTVKASKNIYVLPIPIDENIYNP
ncbi:RagB/SusD family nutrient uptake outer membrane protein [Pedobacter riviphilus]|uniref:RagB/SusD family nutrient uptake outer membrane protein n=2 Tax=Pedobacter riviphilus TaxID=2766984 RepID=A0ABX6TJP6_9SPHI|nr:RagB/SusD family nutrient uptake outer membrane protein [Pedobacter riviphilus]QNR85153.1 RagB/SusD family nutrient uptake outer membrane protein [Pedobacter riviphilus]